MGDGRLALIKRVADALIALESLSEGGVAKIDGKIKGGDDLDLADKLLRDKSPFDYHCSELEDWCKRAEERATRERRRQIKPMTPVEEHYWFFEEWEGKDYRTVADRIGCEPAEVWAKRERAGVNPRDGRAIEKAA